MSERQLRDGNTRHIRNTNCSSCTNGGVIMNDLYKNQLAVAVEYLESIADTPTRETKDPIVLALELKKLAKDGLNEIAHLQRLYDTDLDQVGDYPFVEHLLGQEDNE